MRPSMGTVGDAYDNAMAESFFASLECELIARRTWKTKTEARLVTSSNPLVAMLICFTFFQRLSDQHRCQGFAEVS